MGTIHTHRFTPEIPSHMTLTQEEAWLVLAHRRGIIFTQIHDIAQSEESLEEPCGPTIPDLPAGPIAISRESMLDIDGQVLDGVNFIARVNGSPAAGVCLAPAAINGPRIIYLLDGLAAGGLDPNGFLTAQQAYVLAQTLQRAALELDPSLAKRMIDGHVITPALDVLPEALEA